MSTITAAEQLLLELINRARLDPEGEAARYGIDLNADLAPGTISSDPKQVLVHNALIADASDLHSQWMLDTNTFSHTGAGGSNPGARILAASYDPAGSWSWGENLSWRGTTGTLDPDSVVLIQHRDLFLSEGHRENLMRGDFTEIGIGQVIGQFTYSGTTYNASMVTEKFAVTYGQVFVTGAVYNDTDGNNFYSIGEGIGAMAVSADGTASSTAAAGGYGIEVTGPTADVSFGGGAVQAEVDVSGGNAKLDLVDGDTLLTSADLVMGAGAANAEALGVGDIDVTGNAADNEIIGNAGANVLAGGDGRDILYGELGDDVLNGGAWGDQLHAGAGADTVLGGSGADQAWGLGGDDVMDGGSGNDIMFGGAGNDDIEGGIGMDRLFGDGGSDTLSGGGGDDILRSGAGGDLVYGGSGNDYIDGGGAADILRGENGFDTIDGGAGNDVIDGGNGNDTINGDIGDDRIIGGFGNDSVSGGDGDDRLFGDTGADRLSGGSHHDSLYGGDGADVLMGDAGDDFLSGGRQSDILNGGIGADTLTGGAAQDVYVFAGNFGSDAITDFDVALKETIWFTGVVSATSFTDMIDNHIADTAEGALISYGDASLLLQGIAVADLEEEHFVYDDPLVS